LGKSLRNQEKILGKSWENPGNLVESREILRKIWEKSWENPERILGQSWRSCGKIFGKS
jgi:hypothetical protein